jgi:hypothetical protein
MNLFIYGQQIVPRIAWTSYDPSDHTTARLFETKREATLYSPKGYIVVKTEDAPQDIHEGLWCIGKRFSERRRREVV